MESEGASSFDRLHSVLEELGTQCRRAGELAQSEIIKWFDAKNDFVELCDSVCDDIQQLSTDWVFLIMFYESVDLWTYADDRRKQESGSQTIASVAGSIAIDLGVACQQKYIFYSRKDFELHKVLISECQTKTENLMVEIGAIINSWSEGCLFLDLYREESPIKNYSLNFNPFPRLKKLLKSVVVCLEVITQGTAQHGVNDAVDGNLNKQIHAFYDDLTRIQRYIGGWREGYIFGYGCPNGIEPFLLRIASVAISTANHSCNYWFNKKIDPNVARRKLIAGLVDVQHQISPANPNFINLNLKVLRFFSEFCGSPHLTLVLELNFLLIWVKNEDLVEELKSLVDLVIRYPLQRRCTRFERRLIEETRGLLVEAVSCSEKVCNEAKTDCSVLLVNICLLKVEHFLMVILDDDLFSEIKKPDDVLKNLRKFSLDLPQEKVEYRMQTMALIGEVASLYRSCFDRTKNINVFEVKHSLFQLLYKIMFFKAESFLEELLKINNINLMARGKDQIEALFEELKFFKEFLTNQLMNHADDFHEMFQQVEVVARKISFFSYSFLPNKITELMIEEMITSFAELFNQLKHIKAKLQKICPQFPMPIIPKTCKLLFIDFLIKNIQELLKNDPESIRSVKNHMTEIQQHLESLKSFLTKISELDIEHPDLKDLGNDVMNVVYKVDYIVDIEFGADWKQCFRFYDILKELRFVCKQASRIQIITLNAKAKNVIQVSWDRISGDSTRQASNEMVVALPDQEKVIIDRLTRGSSKRAIVSILGMRGIGKTTLARQVYNSQHVVYHFHRRAWCTLSQVYEKRELLLQILSDIHGLTDEIHDMGNADLESKLCQCLLRNKYLIVFDDVRDIRAWNDLKFSFPDDGNGSRILITTRLCDVALETDPNSEPHHLRQFSDEESWKLLKMKIFYGECCPEELLLVGKDIAQQCKGLPLAVVAISGLLKTTEKRQKWWKKIAECLSSQIISDPEARCMEILELSYRHLPENLKACFLYLGAFLEDKDIPVIKLIRF